MWFLKNTGICYLPVALVRNLRAALLRLLVPGPSQGYSIGVSRCQPSGRHFQAPLWWSWCQSRSWSCWQDLVPLCIQGLHSRSFWLELPSLLATPASPPAACCLRASRRGESAVPADGRTVSKWHPPPSVFLLTFERMFSVWRIWRLRYGNFSLWISWVLLAFAFFHLLFPSLLPYLLFFSCLCCWVWCGSAPCFPADTGSLLGHLASHAGRCEREVCTCLGVPLQRLSALTGVLSVNRKCWRVTQAS